MNKISGHIKKVILLLPFMKKNTTQAIMYLLRPYRLLLVAVFASLVIYAFMEGITIALTYTVLNQTLGAAVSSGANSRILSIVQAISSAFSINDIFIMSCVLLIISYLLKTIASFLSQFSGFYFSSIIKRDLHNRIFGKFLNAEYPFFFEHKHGWLMHRTNTIPSEASVFFDYIPRIAVNALRIAVIMATLFFISPFVTMFIMALAVVYYFVTKVIGGKISYSLGKEKVNELQNQNELAAEAFTGIKQIKVFMYIDTWIDRFKASAARYSKLSINEAAWLIIPQAMIEFIVMSSLLIFLVVAKIRYAGGFVAILPLIAIFGYSVQRIIPCFNSMGVQLISFFGLLPVVEVAHKILTAPEQISDGTVEVEKFSNKISFRKVSFSYSGRESLFKDLAFDINKGSTVAIVGSSGIGKSTIVDLLTRLLRPSEGSICIDGTDLNAVRISSWLDRIGLVTQDNFMFHGTIKENIALASKDINMEAVVRAANEASAHEFISEFPQGYDTIVGDRGVKLSGGQRQRIAIARAVYRDPELLILDEATNALDSVSETLVQRAIDKSAKGRTVIIVSHKLSAIMHADKIMVIHNGKVSEEGRHSELIGKKGLYHELYSTNKITV